jgi:acetyl esterase/lipase
MSDSSAVSRDLDIRPMIDPEVAECLAALPVDLGALFSTVTDEAIVGVRELIAAMPEPPLSDEVERTDHVVEPETGVGVRVHRPIGIEGSLPCVYWMHGGGLILGSNVGDDLRFDEWCRKFGCVGVSVEYRLAPEFPYPTPLEDCYAGLLWVHAHATELGIDPTRIGIGGASAGGGLAAALALLARDRGRPDVAFQLLIYPMLDDRQITASSNWIDPVWPPAANTYAWTAYVGDSKGGDDVPAYAAPARATDLNGLPPTLITVGALDGFCDEDIDYALRLRHAGVPVELHVYPGAPHGFDGLAVTSELARRAHRDIDDWLTARLA